MPPLSLHISVARNVADAIRIGLLDGRRGDLYLGATAPDIRVITRWDRSRTHYFDLDNFGEQSGVDAFFQDNSTLADAACLPASAAAFVAGYATHLVMDETWINTVYRPFFGERSPLKGGLRANVMDRALQFSLDHERRSDADLVTLVVGDVARCDLGLEFEFIDSDTLRRWHQVVIDMLSSTPDWERFRHAAKRHIQNGDAESAEFEELVRSVPDLVDETLRYLSPGLLDDFMLEAFERSLACVRDYLKCA